MLEWWLHRKLRVFEHDYDASGTETVAFDVADDRIVAIYSVRNPDKVRHLS